MYYTYIGRYCARMLLYVCNSISTLTVDAVREMDMHEWWLTLLAVPEFPLKVGGLPPPLRRRLWCKTGGGGAPEPPPPPSSHHPPCSALTPGTPSGTRTPLDGEWHWIVLRSRGPSSLWKRPVSACILSSSNGRTGLFLFLWYVLDASSWHSVYLTYKPSTGSKQVCKQVCEVYRCENHDRCMHRCIDMLHRPLPIVWQSMPHASRRY